MRWNDKKKSAIVVAAAAVAVAAAVGAFLMYRPAPAAAPQGGPASGEPSSTTEAKPPANPPTEEGYEGAVRAALGGYLEARAGLSAAYDDTRASAELVPLRAARAALGNVMVPKDFKDAHLALVLALARIEAGAADRDVAAWQDGEAKLDSWIKDEGWVTGAGAGETVPDSAAATATATPSAATD